MLKKSTLALTFLLAWGITLMISAQHQVVASSGGEGIAAGANLQWTLGESVIQSSGVVAGAQITQGFQQPAYEVQTLVEAPELSFTLDVYPLPASDFLTIKVGTGGFSDLKAVLYDLNGRIVDQKSLGKEVNQIDMQSYSSGHYILNITGFNGNVLKSFKIVKL
ncbi:MAG: T9SS type A sorting domain-containing protein [Bacteroidales bacterium]|nr:T9SS type A sorting domain-containing protein [Bacteroidales bacterium]